MLLHKCSCDDPRSCTLGCNDVALEPSRQELSYTYTPADGVAAFEAAYQANANTRRYEIWRKIGTMLPHVKGNPHRTRLCGSAIPGQDPEAHLFANGSVRFAYTLRCRNGWLCPLCGPRIAAERADRVRALINGTHAMSGVFLMVVLTVRHKATDRLADVKELVTKSLRSARVGNPWLRYDEDNDHWSGIRYDGGFAGVIVAPEVTWGDHGPHYHVHLGIPSVLSDEQEALEAAERLIQRFIRYVRRNGGDAQWTGQSVEVVHDADKAADYFGKTTKDVGPSVKTASFEMAGSVATKTEAASHTIWDLVELAYDGDTLAFARVQEYIEVMPGTRSCRISSDLAAITGAKAYEGQEEPDIEVAEGEQTALGRIPRDHYQAVFHARLIARMQFKLRTGGRAVWPEVLQWAADIYTGRRNL